MKIGIVNDSVIAVEAIRRAVVSDPQHEILWTARDGNEAVLNCNVTPPDLILMDMFMPRLDGVEATRRIMQTHPCPILIVTSSVRAHSSMIFQAMGAGAIDVVATPTFDDEAGRQALLEKIQRLGLLATDARKPSPKSALKKPGEAFGVVLIGCSAGGPAALAEILGALPVDFSAGVVIVQHVDERFTEELAEWLHAQSAIPVRVAHEGDVVIPGQALLAAGGAHLIFRSDGTLGYTAEPKESFYIPSVDILFESALARWTKPMQGILLTGMGRDGAAGLKKLRTAGHFTIAQDEASSALYGMPKAAARIGAACEILPLIQIAHRIVEKAADFS